MHTTDDLFPGQKLVLVYDHDLLMICLTVLPFPEVGLFLEVGWCIWIPTENNEQMPDHDDDMIQLELRILPCHLLFLTRTPIMVLEKITTKKTRYRSSGRLCFSNHRKKITILPNFWAVTGTTLFSGGLFWDFFSFQNNPPENNMEPVPAKFWRELGLHYLPADCFGIKFFFRS